jgi:hypothetical protein
MAKTISKSAKVETAYGQTLAEPVSFNYTYEELQKGDAIPTDEQPDAADLLTYVNQKRNAAARSKAQNDALTNAGIVKPTLEDPAVRLATMVKVLVAAGNSKETAEQIAKSALGM